MTLQSFEEFSQSITESLLEGAEHVYKPFATPQKTSVGHKCVGATWSKDGEKKGANICKHKDTGKYFAAGGSSTAVIKSTTFHNSPEEAASAYHSK